MTLHQVDSLMGVQDYMILGGAWRSSLALSVSNLAGLGSLWMCKLFAAVQLDLLLIRSNPCRPIKDDTDVTLETFVILKLSSLFIKRIQS